MAEAVPHPKFQIVRDGHGHYRFRLTAPNSEALFLSAEYATRLGCRRGIEAVRQHAAGAGFEDLTAERPGGGGG